MTAYSIHNMIEDMQDSDDSAKRSRVPHGTKIFCSGATVRSAVHLTSRIVVPLVIGFITVFIAIHQQNRAQSSRDKDAAQSAELRKQDLELTRLQREEDRETARAQREEDKEAARLQRTFDLKMANDKRLQEYEIAERQLNLTQIQREHEFEINRQTRMSDLLLADERQKENVLSKYQNDLLTLILDYRHMLIESHEDIRFVLQMKTRAALRQLDPQRRTIIVRNIVQAGILDNDWRGSKSILYKANISGVDFSSSTSSNISDYLLIYNNLDIEMADGRFTILRHISLSHRLSLSFSNFDYADWSFSQLKYVDFDKHASINEAKFIGTSFSHVSFHGVEMNRASFQDNNLCSDCMFLETTFIGARLERSKFKFSTFARIMMPHSNMSHGSFEDSTFQDLTLDLVDLSGAHFQRCKFSRVSMVNCSMFKTTFNATHFSNVSLLECKGFTDEQLYTLLGSSGVVFPNGTLYRP